jgi:hypothetical protein
MLIINLIKVGAIWIADIINRLIDPFEETAFTDTTNLEGLENLFSVNLEAGFKRDGWFLYQTPFPEDAGDCALFQGLYTAYRFLKGDLEGDLCPLSSLFKNARLIRGYRADGTVNDTTSNDAGTGMLLALYCAWQYMHPMVLGLSTVQWAQRIIDDGYALADQNGAPTTYGQLEQGWKTDPLRVTLLLAILALAMKIDRAKFEPHYDAIYRKYKEILPYAKVKLLWWDTDYDTHRAAIHLHILWELTRDETYKDGLLRLHRITRKANNAWVNVLCAPVLAPEDVNLSILSTFHSGIRSNRQSLNSGTVESVKWGSNELAKKALPIWRRGGQDFFWQRNMFSLDEWVGNTGADSPEYTIHYTGLDFLLCYWMAKRQGLL